MSDSTPTTKSASFLGTLQGRLAIVAGVLVLAFGAYKMGFISMSSSGPSVVPVGVELAQLDTSSAGHALTLAPLAPPCGSALAHVGGPNVRVYLWEWNAQMGIIGANCGPKTMAGSLMEKYGVNVTLNHSEDTNLFKTDQIKFASAIAGGNPNPGDGATFVIIMGDGAPSYLYDVNKKLAKLGPDYRAEIVGAVGFSGNKISGEDAIMGPAEWSPMGGGDPNMARGSLIAGVLRDGDWNIAQAWLNANGICNNPDERYLDLNCANWVSVDSPAQAAQMYIENHCEDRYIVKVGKVTTEKRNACTKAAVVWTPADVAIAKKKGGLVKLLSTKENAMQMPAVLIGIHQWNVTHPKQVEGLLQATFEMGDQIKAYPEALTRAAKASWNVYGGDETPAYWAKYYRGVIEADATGQRVPLGGSRVAGYDDNRFLFGMNEDIGLMNSAFNASYAGFGKVASVQYPKQLPSFPATSEAVNLTFLTTLASKLGGGIKAETPTFERGDIAPENTTARTNVNIQFATGSDSFSPTASAQLDLLFNQLTNASTLNVEIDGHTDNTGTPETNMDLSARRADAVRRYLVSRNRTMFPDNRVVVHGFGQTKPLHPTEDQTSAAERAANRRVTIILGTSN